MKARRTVPDLLVFKKHFSKELFRKYVAVGNEPTF